MCRTKRTNALSVNSDSKLKADQDKTLNDCSRAGLMTMVVNVFECSLQLIYPVWSLTQHPTKVSPIQTCQTMLQFWVDVLILKNKEHTLDKAYRPYHFGAEFGRENAANGCNQLHMELLAQAEEVTERQYHHFFRMSIQPLVYLHQDSLPEKQKFEFILEPPSVILPKSSKWMWKQGPFLK